VKKRSLTYRKIKNSFVSVFAGLSALLGLIILGWILYTVFIKGFAAFNWAFFTELPNPPGMSGGGLANAIMGTIILTLLASLMGVPLGLFAGIYLSEFGKNSKFASSVRFFSNILMGTPSIIVGIFVYTILVVPFGHFSAYAGAVALAIMMLPVIARTTDDMLQMVPASIRESALALGAPRWRTTLQVVFRSAKTGLITGVLLAVARISGETAPLLFTALNSPYWMTNLSEPTSNLTVTIFNYAMSPYEDWQQMAWGASLLITAGVLAITLTTRFLLKDRKKK
jgi:phosphate transport system permease protein